MARPLVAIVGRPNVGKSTFFNQMAGRRIAIVEDTPGVTRDRVYVDCEWQKHKFTLIDTGGIDPKSDDPLLKQMRRQAEIAIETCDVILFFVDGRQGLTSDDEDVADLLRKAGKPVKLVVNKIDNIGMMDNIYDFYQLGMGDPIGISSVNLLNLGDMLEEICSYFPDPEEEADEQGAIQIAVVGKPNAGKSSLVNRILGEDRVMVSDIADRCDVAILMIDAIEGVTEQDTKIAGYIDEQGKAAIICINKWDIKDKETGTLEKYVKQVREDLKFMAYAPVLFISALTGKRVEKVLDTVRSVYAEACKRITTGVLNDVLADAQAYLQPPSTSGRRLKIYYATQQSACPPTFVIFLNDEKLMRFGYERYLENQFRKAFGFEGTPIRFFFRERNKKED